jgi:RNA polymerase sigma factor (sigma-70 family)
VDKAALQKIQGQLIVKGATPIEAEDAIQDAVEVMLKYRNRGQVVEDEAAFVAKVAWRKWVDQWRRFRKGKAYLPLDDPALFGFVEHNPYDAIDDQRYSEQLTAMLKQHEDGLVAKIFFLHLQHGFTQREIATKLGISEDQVHRRIGKAAALLAKQVVR